MSLHPVPVDAPDRAAARRSRTEAVGVDLGQGDLRPAWVLAAGRNRRHG